MALPVAQLHTVYSVCVCLLQRPYFGALERKCARAKEKPERSENMKRERCRWSGIGRVSQIRHHAS